MKTALGIAWLLAGVTVASAQQSPSDLSAAGQQAIPTEATNKLAKDLASLRAKFAAQQLAAQQAAQGAGPTRKKIEVTRSAEVLGGADPSAPFEFKASKGDYFTVVDKQNGYYAVVRNDGKTGWIPAGYVRPKFYEDKLDWEDWLGVAGEDTKIVKASDPSI